MFVLILFRVPFSSLCFSHRLRPLFHIPSFACVVFCLWNLCCSLHLGGTFSSFSSHLDHHSFKEVLGCIDQNEKIHICNMYYTYYICKIYTDLTNGVSFNSLGYKSSLSLFWFSNCPYLTNGIPFMLSSVSFWHVLLILWALPSLSQQSISRFIIYFPVPTPELPLLQGALIPFSMEHRETKI